MMCVLQKNQFYRNGVAVCLEPYLRKQSWNDLCEGVHVVKV